jgi:hypothetical protein
MKIIKYRVLTRNGYVEFKTAKEAEKFSRGRDIVLVEEDVEDPQPAQENNDGAQ